MYNIKSMKILKQEKTGSKYKFEVEVDYASYLEARNEVLESFSKEMRVPGFRAGKAPKNLIKKNFSISLSANGSPLNKQSYIQNCFKRQKSTLLTIQM